MKNDKPKDELIKRWAIRCRRAIIAHTLAVVASWISLMYGWGIEVERPLVLLAFWFWAGVIWPVVIPYVLREV
jgi:hypothetical protein